MPTLVGPALSSIGPLAFGPEGVLYAADRQAARVHRVAVLFEELVAGALGVGQADRLVAEVDEGGAPPCTTRICT